jgi:hypothetical protein
VRAVHRLSQEKDSHLGPDLPPKKRAWLYFRGTAILAVACVLASIGVAGDNRFAGIDEVIGRFNSPRNRSAIEFLDIWEHLNNADFKPVKFDGFRKQA